MFTAPIHPDEVVFTSSYDPGRPGLGLVYRCGSGYIYVRVWIRMWVCARVRVWVWVWVSVGGGQMRLRVALATDRSVAVPRRCFLLRRPSPNPNWSTSPLSPSLSPSSSSNLRLVELLDVLLLLLLFPDYNYTRHVQSLVWATAGGGPTTYIPISGSQGVHEEGPAQIRLV